MSNNTTNNEARIGLSLLNAGLAEFSDAVDAAALEAYQAHIRKLDGVTEAPLDLPEEARDMFLSGYWIGHAAGLKAANEQLRGRSLARSRGAEGGTNLSAELGAIERNTMNQNLIAAHKHMTDAKNALVLTILAFEEIGADSFDHTIKELKETVGDLCASLKTIEDFEVPNDTAKGIETA